MFELSKSAWPKLHIAVKFPRVVKPANADVFPARVSPPKINVCENEPGRDFSGVNSSQKYVWLTGGLMPATPRITACVNDLGELELTDALQVFMCRM